MRKNRYKNMLLALCLGIFVASCNLSTPQVANPSNDATVTGARFLMNDSSPNASQAVFIIDNVNGTIYNADSLPFGTRVDSLRMSFTFASTLGYIMNDTVAESFNSYYQGQTSKHYDFTKPVKIKNLATNGKATKEYTFDVRVHKVESYLHVWTKLKSEVMANAPENQKALFLNGKFYYFFGTGTANLLYTSADAVHWSKESSPVGLPLDATIRNMIIYNNSFYLLHQGSTVYKSADGIAWTATAISGNSKYDYVSLLFAFKNKIWAAAKNKTDKSVRIANSSDGVNWTFSGKTVFANSFPVSDFAATSFQPTIGREKVILLGGYDAFGTKLNTRWSAENITSTDTLNWANLTNNKSRLDSVSDVGIEYYGSRLLMVGGKNKDNKVVVDSLQLRQSEDEGLTWLRPNTLINQRPKDFLSRTNSSMIVDKKDKTLYIIGGGSHNAGLSDVWKIKVNFYNFKDYLDGTIKY